MPFPRLSSGARATARCGAVRRPGTASPSWPGGQRPCSSANPCRAIAQTRKADTSRRRSTVSSSAVSICPRPGQKFAYKLAWSRRLQDHARKLLKSGAPVVLAGDYNAVPTDFDIYSMASWKDDALVQPETRAAYRRLLDQGWTDALRTLHPEKPMYTFWDYKRRRWERDAGLRIDHLLLAPVLMPRLRKGGVDRAVRGAKGASDHAPAWIDIK